MVGVICEETEYREDKIGGNSNSKVVWLGLGRGCRVIFGMFSCLPNLERKCGRERGLDGNLPICSSPPSKLFFTFILLVSI